MPAGDPNFRNDYRADPDLPTKLADVRYDDPRLPGFLDRYRRWREDGSDVHNPEGIQHHFGDPGIIRQALDLGDATNSADPRGLVLVDASGPPDDFEVLNNYIGQVYLVKGAQLVTEKDFEEAVRALLAGEALTDEQKSWVNGAVIVRAKLQTAFDLPPGSDPVEQDFIFAVPGTVAARWRYTVSAGGFWEKVANNMTTAFETTGSRLINLSGAIQIRTGQAPYKPIKVGSGMVIMGGV